MKKYPGKEIRKYYFDLLSDIKIDNKEIPVYNLARIGIEPPYIMLVNQTATGRNTKGSYSDDTTILIQCVTHFEGNFGGDQYADKIANEVTEKIFENRPDYGTTNNFKIVTTQITSNETLREQTSTDVLIIRQLTISNYVEQLN